jgi:hypothetical protein
MEFGWQFLCSDIDIESLQFARMNISKNKLLADNLQLVHVPSCESLQLRLSLFLIKFDQIPSKNKSNKRKFASVADDRDDEEVSDTIHAQANLISYSVDNQSLDIDSHLDVTAHSIPATLSVYLKSLYQTCGIDKSICFGPILHALQASDHKGRRDDIDAWISEFTSTKSHQSHSPSQSGSYRDHLDTHEEIKLNQQEDKILPPSGLNRHQPQDTCYNPILSATMCNPPFYDRDEDIQSNNRTINTGSLNEIRTIGGEINFITAMIADSLIIKERYPLRLLYYLLYVLRCMQLGSFGIRPC